MKNNRYTPEAVKNATRQYIERGGGATTLYEDVLLDALLLEAKGCESIVALPRYVSEWSSDYEIKSYKTEEIIQKALAQGYEQHNVHGVHFLYKDNEHKSLVFTPAFITTPDGDDIFVGYKLRKYNDVPNKFKAYAKN